MKPTGSGVAILAAAGIPAAITLILTSKLTFIGDAFYEVLTRDHIESDGVYMWYACMLAGGLLVAVGYLLDVHLWRGAWQLVAFVYFTLSVCILFGGVLFYTVIWPSIPIMAGICISILCVWALRRFLLADLHEWQFAQELSQACIGLAAVFAGVWLLWLGGVFDGAVGLSVDAWKENMRANYRTHAAELHDFVRWCSPAILSASLLIMAGFTAIRSHIHKDDLAQEDQEMDDAGTELKIACVCLAATVLIVWSSATLLVQSMELSKTVARLAVFAFVMIIAYLVLSVGVRNMAKAAEKNSTVAAAADFAHSDWMKGLILVISWPILPLYFGLEVLHKMVRTLMRGLGAVEDGGKEAKEAGVLTVEAYHIFHNIWSSWNWTSVLVKSMYWGIMFFAIQVIFGSGITILLSWVNEQIAPWPLWAIMSLLFVLGISLFLLPPVPGLPIYFVSGIVISERFVADGYSFWLGCFVASLFCFAIKLAAIALEQKAIGEPFSETVEVKKMIGVHTPAMKAVRHILVQPGMRLDKIAILVGGPDWPTSVLTGVLRLPLLSMLLGSSPVYFLILSVVMAACLQVRAGSKDDPNVAQYQSMATVMLMVTTVVQGTALMMAGYYMQAVAEEHKEEIENGNWETDPQEAEVLESVKKDEAEAAKLEIATAWRFTPMSLKAVLLSGSMTASLMIHILISPFFNPFKDFTLTDKISDLPGGSALAVINVWGWIDIGIFCYVCVAAAVHHGWSRYRMKSPELEEEAPLVSKTA
eukprot:TRINITY_DN101588_c0_g1_i1.p1 TRINITY_DN101588_c0_g1~~TRINITY_DN101588_c0_g1_i1.p1  ORF type:complete len:759 (+),score=175.80 TRINITY_DN101588_c0_g1_i1:140-2416(+)